MIFSLAGPWEKGEFIQIVPTEESAIEFFRGICNNIKAPTQEQGSWIEDEEVGPIAEYIVSAFSE